MFHGRVSYRFRVLYVRQWIHDWRVDGRVTDGSKSLDQEYTTAKVGGPSISRRRGINKRLGVSVID